MMPVMHKDHKEDRVVSTNTIGIGCQEDHKENRLSAQILLVLAVGKITRRTGCQHKYYWY